MSICAEEGIRVGEECENGGQSAARKSIADMEHDVEHCQVETTAAATSPVGVHGSLKRKYQDIPLTITTSVEPSDVEDSGRRQGRLTRSPSAHEQKGKVSAPNPSCSEDSYRPRTP